MPPTPARRLWHAGAGAALFETHIAYDIGAAQVTRALAAAYGAAAVLGRWSRLLIDLNRGAGRSHPGDETVGRQHHSRATATADAAEVARRIAAVSRALSSRRSRAEIDTHREAPALISLHSFTPAWKGEPRPWEVGVLWDKDGRLARPLMARLAEAGFRVGDNEPYRGALEGDALNSHGTRRGLPHVLIEMRQDLIADEPWRELSRRG